jgi:hypothetical protein
MPRYDIVVHASIELDSATPEQAGAVFARCLRDGVDPTAVVRGMAVWRPDDGETATPLPPPLPDQLADFFAGVRWSAAAAENTFRLEVERIMAAAFPDGAEAPADASEETEVGR